MTARVLMVQGTASHVGKSVLVSALCRIFRQDGFKVAPFKAQNMSNNSYVTRDGGEIGRAQAVQAEAAGVEAQVQMNPVLLKPEADHIAQVVLMGKPLISAKVRDYFGLKAQLWESVSASLDVLREQYDIVVIEGAGSPAEINLKATEIVNMRVAKYAEAPVLLCGDIDRGGVFAALVGTMELLDPDERDIVKAFIINKFRGDASLLTDGLDMLEARTGIPVAGVVHHFRDIHIPEEDSVALDLPAYEDSGALLNIAVIKFPHLSNFDDFEPLGRENGVALKYVESVDELQEPDLIILPGSKTTMSDLTWMNSQGLTEAIKDFHSSRTPIIGVCGGYQMLGNKLYDPEEIESSILEMDGLGILPMTTLFGGTKETHRIQGEVCGNSGLLSKAVGESITGYEIHMGQTTGSQVHPVFAVHDRSDVAVTNESSFDGASDADGDVFGTYIHGVFHNGGFRRAVLNELAHRKGVILSLDTRDLAIDQEFDKLAAWVRASLDMELIYKMVGLDVDNANAGLTG